MKKVKKVSARRHDDGETVKSPVIRVGVAFVVIMAIVLVAWAVKVYTPPLP